MIQKMKLVTGLNPQTAMPVQMLVESSELESAPPEDFLPSGTEGVRVEGEVEIEDSGLKYGWPTGMWTCE